MELCVHRVHSDVFHGKLQQFGTILVLINLKSAKRRVAYIFWFIPQLRHLRTQQLRLVVIQLMHLQDPGLKTCPLQWNQLLNSPFKVKYDSVHKSRNSIPTQVKKLFKKVSFLKSLLNQSSTETPSFQILITLAAGHREKKLTTPVWDFLHLTYCTSNNMMQFYILSATCCHQSTL